MTEDFDNELKAILAELENPGILLAVSLDLQEQDRQNGTHTYEAFKSSIITLEPGFRPRFTEAETRAMLALGTDKLKNSISTDKVIKQATDDGFMLKASLDGTDRAISRLGSKYALSSSIEIRAALEEVQGIDKILQENLKPLVDDLQVIRSRLDETLTRDRDFYTFKREFQTLHPDLYTLCGLDGANSFEEARMPISKYEILLQEKIDDLEEAATEAKAQLIAEMKVRAEKKDASGKKR